MTGLLYVPREMSDTRISRISNLGKKIQGRQKAT